MACDLFPTGTPPSPRRCPRCDCPNSHRWGRFSGRQRYRCLDCRRTFSTFTGTALHYLKRIDRWDGFCLAMLRTETVRETATRLAVDRDTAFRWRHRFLATLARGESVLLSGDVAAGITRFRYTRKGARLPDPVALAAAERGDAHAWVALARDGHGAATSALKVAAGIGVAHLVEALAGRVAPDVVLRSHEGPYSQTAICARRLRLEFKPLPPHPRPARDPERITFYALRIRQWMARFRGVATRYLPHYLVWFRAADAEWQTDRWKWWEVMPAGVNTSGRGTE